MCSSMRNIVWFLYWRRSDRTVPRRNTGGLSYKICTKQHHVTLKDIFLTNLAVLSTRSGKVFKIASLWRILMHFFQVFNDVHMLMCTLGAKNEDATLKLLASLREFVRYILPYSFSCLLKTIRLLSWTRHLGYTVQDAILAVCSTDFLFDWR